MKRIELVKIGGAVLVLTVVISVIMLIPNWDGEQASTAAPVIDNLLDVMIVLSSFVFSIVIVMLGYSLLRWRAKPGDESDGEPIHGNTRLEIGWTVIPTIIVLFGAVYSAVKLGDIEAKDPDRMTVDVVAQQYEWTFNYPKQKISSHQLHVPVDHQIEFHLTAIDVLHSFWVPEWRIKRDLVPSGPGGDEIDSDFVVTPNKVGSYSLVCTELCGWGHATMRAAVVVEPRAAFNRWVAKQQAASAAGPAAASGGGTS